MAEEEDRGKYIGNCIQPISPAMVVCQLVGENQTQKSMDICVRVPRRNPAIDQIIDVYVKDLKLTYVNAICDKVIVRGCYEVKVLYAACEPKKPVHAIEVRNIRFTADVDIWGASSGMDAEADVVVEFIDYDCDECTRAHWYKHNPDWDYRKSHWKWDDDWDDDCDCDDEDDCDHGHHHDCDCDHCKPHKPHHHKKKKYCQYCGHDYDHCDCDHDHDYCDHCGHDYDHCDCGHDHDHCDHCGHDYDHCSCDHGHHHHWKKKGARRCDVTVVLRVTAKVFRNRPVLLQQHGGYHAGMHHGKLPLKPKG
ncbi:DUF3794 domain-containing protein [Anaerospora hongkongensis]|uniref:DUF3794 domain-containing protein n=1 Tax=Anaerospora hongkongensis TaxID=244830 RepID=UPI00289F3198|nr:DUF3794 domain-containing protein [Anaerospora hongkongensis]